MVSRAQEKALIMTEKEKQRDKMGKLNMLLTQRLMVGVVLIAIFQSFFLMNFIQYFVMVYIVQVWATLVSTHTKRFSREGRVEIFRFKVHQTSMER
jgi:hypothetical protein